MLFQSHRLPITQLRQKLWTGDQSQCSPSSASKEEYRNMGDRVQTGILYGVNALLDKQTRKWTVIFARRVGLSWKTYTVTMNQVPSVVSIRTSHASLPKELYGFSSRSYQFRVSLHFSVSTNIFLVDTAVCGRNLRQREWTPALQ